MKKLLILVVREIDKFSRILAENGFETINFPAIRTRPIEDFSELKRRIYHLNDYDGLFLTSPKAAEVFLQNVGNEEDNFRGKFYVLGKRTKDLFENTNFEIVFRSYANTAEEFINSFETDEFAGKRFLFLKGDESLRTIPELLEEQSIVDEIVVYRTIENTIDAHLKNKISDNFSENEIDWICFFSPSGIENFVKTFGEFLQKEIKIAVIGSTTAKKAVENNLKVEFVSSKANAEDFAFELIDFIKNKKL